MMRDGSEYGWKASNMVRPGKQRLALRRVRARAVKVTGLQHVGGWESARAARVIKEGQRHRAAKALNVTSIGGRKKPALRVVETDKAT